MEPPKLDVFTAEEIERFVRSTGENDFVDGKAPVTWNDSDTKASLAKDIAAFANSGGGGAIVLGKAEREDKSFDFVGMSPSECATFDTTKVAQWVNNHFSPNVRLSCHTVEVDSKLYVVITIAEFGESPILCTKSYKNKRDEHILRQGTIYIRTANAQSAPINTPEQLSQLVGRAVLKRQDQLRELLDSVLAGRTARNVPTDEEKFSAQKEIVQKDLLLDSNSIERGAWTFVIHPETFEPRWKANDELRTVILRSSLPQRRFPREFPQLVPRDWGLSDKFNGVWGITHEGLFFYCRGYWENDTAWKSPNIGEEEKQVAPGQWIDFGGSMNRVVDFFAFAHRFAQSFDSGAQVRYIVGASSLMGRHLLRFNHSAELMDFDFPPCAASGFQYSNTISAGQIVAGWKSLCADCLKAFVDRFPGGEELIHRNTIEQWVEQIAATTG